MTSNFFSRPVDSEYPDRESLSIESEICFQIPESSELNLELLNHDSAALNYLIYCVVRNPSDLISHMRRIILHEKIGDRDSLYAALIDLFIVLGAKGRSLRIRLLKRYRSRLSRACYLALASSFQHPITAADNLFCRASVLSKGITGTCSLVRPVSETGAIESTDPLKEAREYLEYSQIDEARQVLERAVLDNPETIEFQTELLELYRAGRDMENFQKIHRELMNTGVPLSDDWSIVSDFLAENA